MLQLHIAVYKHNHYEWEWVEIIEPRTKEHMYANLTTGECVWDPPPGVKIKKTDNNQWWELFDPNTSRFYYYNASSQKTVWHRPTNCDIIPLAKLQTLKQNTEVRNEDLDRLSSKREISTQTPVAQTRREHPKNIRTGSIKSGGAPQTSPNVSRKQRFSRQDSNSSQSSSSRHDSFKEVNGENVRRRSSQSSQSTQAGYSSSSPPVPSSVLRRESSTDMSPRGYDSPRSGRAHSMQRSVSEVTPSALPVRSNSYRFTNYGRDDSQPHYAKIRAHDDSDLSYSNRSKRHGSDYGSRSDSYSSPNPEMYSSAFGYSTNQNSVPQELHDRLYSPVLTTNKDQECIAFSQDIVAQQGHASPIPQKQKLRSFPRTNPSFVGVPKRNGSTTYKRLNVEQQPVSYEPTSVPDPGTFGTSDIVIAPGDYVGGHYYHPHERSDSDTSHSSTRAVRHERADSQTSFSSRNRDLSDSQSSQGSLRDMHSSHGSLRLQQLQSEMKGFNDSISSRGSHKSAGDIDIVHVKSGSQLSHDSRVSDDSEPDYANVPTQSERTPSFPTNLNDATNFKEVLKDNQNIVNYPEDFQPNTNRHSREKVILNYPHDFQIDPSMLNEQYGHLMNRGHRSAPVFENFPGEVELNQSFEDVEDASNMYSVNDSPPGFDLSHHTSLKRKKPEKGDSLTGSPAMEKSHSMQADMMQQRPASMVVPYQTETNVSISPSIGSLNRQNRAGTAPPIRSASPLSQKQKLHSETDIENYMNRHKKGLFGKKISYEAMLVWQKDLIQKPILRTEDKGVKKDACEVFRLIQVYMADRKGKGTQISNAQEIIIKGWHCVALRDEIYMQLCKQTTDNPKLESLQKGWELMAVCLNFFPPTVKFKTYLEGYISRYMDTDDDLPDLIVSQADGMLIPISHFAKQCNKRLEKMVQSGPKKGQRKPNIDEIEQAKKSIFNPSMFGSTLEEILALQCERFPDRKLPWLQTTLSEEVLRLNGAQTEGIFRVPGDIDEVNALKIKCDQWIIPSDCPDPHIPASLLKLWYRELQEPLIPPEFYEECIENFQNPEEAIEVVNKLPDINRLVLAYLIRFLQVFAAEDNSKVTKMDVNNLAMVMAPNCLRCESLEPQVIFENTRKEMGFIRTLIQNLDTSFMEGIV
ncbi:rho GTPase-activating protein 39-like isoform X3 [Mytilus trossulus]|uniref:rho GTPase-activating protein 39-like isoform X3 n=1 Tax=Mytilus trossulus TaxID=6551 RepID=UPI003005BF06